MRLVAGRWITSADNADAPPVVVINDGFAERHFPEGSPLGQRINMSDPQNPRWREIVGVAAEVRYFGVRDDSRDALYLPYEQATTSSVIVTLRSSRELAGLGGEVRGVVAAMDPSLAVAQIQTMESVVAASLGGDRFVKFLTSLFAGLAMVLAVVGLYGVVSCSVSQRRREMGVRLALGAEGRAISGMIMKQSLTFVAIGLFVGVIGGLALTRLMEGLLFGVSASDPWTYGVVAVTLTAVAAAASALPARTAARVDPIQVLKTE